MIQIGKIVLKIQHYIVMLCILRFVLRFLMKGENGNCQRDGQRGRKMNSCVYMTGQNRTKQDRTLAGRCKMLHARGDTTSSSVCIMVT